jgi:hypothetical protein
MADWDKIVTAAPVSGQAAMVRDGIGEPSEFRFNLPNVWRSHAPPKMRKVDRQRNFTGAVIGKLTVVGLVAPSPEFNLSSGKKPLWAVKCACGYYEVMRSRAIKKLLADANRTNECSECHYRSRLKGGHYD